MCHQLQGLIKIFQRKCIGDHIPQIDFILSHQPDERIPAKLISGISAYGDLPQDHLSDRKFDAVPGGGNTVQQHMTAADNGTHGVLNGLRRSGGINGILHTQSVRFFIYPFQ